jgi:uncharacterized protein YbjT (DUF2867 family)
MKLLVFGASGATGKRLIAQAALTGHEVTGFVRRSASPPLVSGAVRVVEGDVRDRDAVDAAVKGQDVVVSALGATGRTRICALGTRIITEAMSASGVRRLVVLSSFGACESRDRSLYVRVLWASITERMEDKEEMEALVRSTRLDWTIIRAPALHNGRGRGRYRLQTTAVVALWTVIARDDVARAMLDLATSGGWVREVATVLPA